MPQPLNIAGERFSRLVAVHRVKSTVGSLKKPHKRWLCRCDCGGEIIASAYRLRIGQIKSCGCLAAQMLEDHRMQRPPEVRNAWGAYRTCRQAAVTRGYDFELTFEQFMAIVKLDCVYCGSKPSNVKRGKSKAAPLFLYSGIDREDNSVGYLWGNCVPCCAKCNWMKKSDPSPVFVAHCIQIVYNQFARMHSGKFGFFMPKGEDGNAVSMSQQDRIRAREMSGNPDFTVSDLVQ